MDSTLEKHVIAGIGELLWDVVGDSEELGGAPANFAYHAGALGARAYAISCVGDDARGRAALEELEKRGVSTRHIVTLPGAETGFVLANVDREGVASYRFPDDIAWDRLEVHDETKELALRLDAICFGSLAQRSPHSRETITLYLKSLQERTLKVFDLNIRQDFYSHEIIENSLDLADVLKLNDDEIVLVAEMLGLSGDQQSKLKQLVARYSLKLAVLTRGGNGSLLVTPEDVSDHGGYPADIIDTIGAGDSFTAAVIHGLLKRHPLDRINEHANRLAAYVCSCRGAMPSIPDKLLQD